MIRLINEGLGAKTKTCEAIDERSETECTHPKPPVAFGIPDQIAWIGSGYGS